MSFLKTFLMLLLGALTLTAIAGGIAAFGIFIGNLYGSVYEWASMMIGISIIAALIETPKYLAQKGQPQPGG